MWVLLNKMLLKMSGLHARHPRTVEVAQSLFIMSLLLLKGGFLGAYSYVVLVQVLDLNGLGGRERFAERVGLGRRFHSQLVLGLFLGGSLRRLLAQEGRCGRVEHLRVRG